MYIPAIPMTPQNLAYIEKQKEAFLSGAVPPDFPKGPGETDFIGVGKDKDIIGDTARKAMGLAYWWPVLDDDSSVDILTCWFITSSVFLLINFEVWVYYQPLKWESTCVDSSLLKILVIGSALGMEELLNQWKTVSINRRSDTQVILRREYYLWREIISNLEFSPDCPNSKKITTGKAAWYGMFKESRTCIVKVAYLV